MGDIDAAFAGRWDALPEQRGEQADIYDSFAWLSSWLGAAPAGTSDRLVIPAVLAGDEPVALLPLIDRRHGRALIAGADLRTRARPVLGVAEPSPEVLDALAEAIAQTGIRELALHRLPSRDPATAELIGALKRAGFQVTTHPRACDHLAPARAGWAEYRRALKGFASYAKRFTARLTSLWDVECEEFGTSAERPVAHGFAAYEELQQRSWKGGFDPTIRRQRIDLLERAEARGWARIYVLRVGGIPVAAHVWFRLGGVATWLSTAYDQTLAALSPGTVIMWEAQSRLFTQDPPQLVDLLPGANPQKERLTLERPPLYVTDAVRQTLWSGVTLPATQRIRQVRRGLAARMRARANRSVGAPELPAPRLASVEPAVDGRPVHTVTPDPAMRRYLATANGLPSPAAVAETWGTDDRWFAVDAGPRALLRVSLAADPPVVRETVALDPDADPIDLARQLAGHVGREVLLDPTAVRHPVLPWPDTWRTEATTPADRVPTLPEVSADAR